MHMLCLHMNLYARMLMLICMYDDRMRSTVKVTWSDHELHNYGVAGM